MVQEAKSNCKGPKTGQNRKLRILRLNPTWFWSFIYILVLNIKRYIILERGLVLSWYNIRLELGLETYGEAMAFMDVTTLKLKGFLL